MKSTIFHPVKWTDDIANIPQLPFDVQIGVLTTASNVFKYGELAEYVKSGERLWKVCITTALMNNDCFGVEYDALHTTLTDPDQFHFLPIDQFFSDEALKHQPLKTTKMKKMAVTLWFWHTCCHSGMEVLEDFVKLIVDANLDWLQRVIRARIDQETEGSPGSPRKRDADVAFDEETEEITHKTPAGKRHRRRSSKR